MYVCTHINIYVDSIDMCIDMNRKEMGGASLHPVCELLSERLSMASAVPESSSLGISASNRYCFQALSLSCVYMHTCMHTYIHTYVRTYLSCSWSCMSCIFLMPRVRAIPISTACLGDVLPGLEKLGSWEQNLYRSPI